MRIPRELMWMDMCEVAARRSTCYRGNVGAMVIHNNDVVSTGYNGPPSGHRHCDGPKCGKNEYGGCLRSDHAEKNAITRAIGKLRVSDLGGMHLYCTSAPCLECAKLIEGSHVGRMYFRNFYRDPTGLNHLLSLERNYPILYRVMPSGVIIHQKTGQILQSDDTA